MKLGPNQQAWVNALRSGDYKQGTIYLNRDGAFCCLGVACEVLGITGKEAGVDFVEYGGKHSGAPVQVVSTMKLRNTFGRFSNSSAKINGCSSLADLNDSGKMTFNDIADIIEQNAELIFTKSN